MVVSLPSRSYPFDGGETEVIQRDPISPILAGMLANPRFATDSATGKHCEVRAAKITPRR
jgi:hypothetical protein